ncbi:MAG: c-type cytochrome [Calditrichia bacterium]
MMKFLKWMAIILGVIIILIIVSIAIIYFKSNSKLNKTYNIKVESILTSSDSSSIAHGRHIAVIRGCMDCHGKNLSGKKMMDNPAMGTIYAPNLTSGEGGIGGHYTTKDWVRSIRHGVNRNGRPIVMMPSHLYYDLSESDIAALVSYLQQLSAVDNITDPLKIGPVMRMLIVTGKMLLSAEIIDHDAGRIPAPEPGVTVEYGRYLAVICKACHGPGLSGGKIADGDPSWPPASNITPDRESGIGNWTEEDFLNAMRKGRSKDGRKLHPAMPRSLSEMTDDELRAVWLFLQSVPPIPFGNH